MNAMRSLHGLRLQPFNRRFPPRLSSFSSKSSYASHSPSLDAAEYSKSIKILLEKRSWGGIATQLKHALDQDVALSSKEYLTGLLACSQISNESNMIAFSLFEKLQNQATLPILAYYRLMEVCSTKYPIKSTTPDHSKKALEIVKLYEEKKFSPNARFYSFLLMTLSRSHEPDTNQQIDHYYAKLIAVLDQADPNTTNNKDSQVNISVFYDLLHRYRKSENPEWVTRIFGDLLTHNLPIPRDTYFSILSDALTYGNTSLLSLGIDYYWKYLSTEKIDYGIIQRLLQVASARGIPELAEKGLELLTHLNYPSTVPHHACRVRAYIQNRNFLGALQAICQSESLGIKFCDPSQPGLNLAHDLSYHFGKALARNLTDLDDMYYLCVDLVPRNVAVPKLVLDAILISSAHRAQTDRAFATFQEFSNLFNVKPDCFSYNCLLLAVSMDRHPSVPTVLKIFQSMQQNDINPDGLSISHLLSTMVSCDDLSAFPQVADMVKDQNLTISPHTLRRVALAFAKLNQWDNVDKVRNLISGGKPWPEFFRERLVKLRDVKKKRKSR